jgi:hypothetical protein
VPASGVPSNTANGNDTLQNPLFDERPWFHTVSSSDIPIHIGEAADAAFATRFRQTLATVYTSHLPRMSYVPDAPLTMLSASQYRWPSPARARFLIKVALSTVCRYFHIIRKSVVQENLEGAINSNGNGDRLIIGKLLALFALGEVYSAKTAAQEAIFPGVAYFAQARSLVSEPMERPQLDSVEVALLLVSILWRLFLQSISNHFHCRQCIRSHSIGVTQHISSPALQSGSDLSWVCS